LFYNKSFCRAIAPKFLIVNGRTEERSFYAATDRFKVLRIFEGKNQLDQGEDRLIPFGQFYKKWFN